MKVAVVGCGAIGAALVRAVLEGRAGAWDLTCVLDRNGDRARQLRVPACAHLGDLLAAGPDLVVEAASQEAVRTIGPAVLAAGCDLMILSIGALVDAALTETLLSQARARGRKIYLPSGAIAGLDGVAAAAIAGIDEVIIESRKHPAGFAGVAFLAERGIDPARITQETVLFEGRAREAAHLFPKNANVCAALALAGVGPERTRVRVIADPHATANRHRIELRGPFGAMTAETCNVVSPDNPKTSYLTALSAIALLRRLTNPLQVGT